MPFVSKLVCHARESNMTYHGMLRDISIIGLFMELDDRPVVGHPCDIDIIFDGDHSRLIIENVRGMIVRSDQDGVAVRFDQRLEWFILIPLYYHKISGKTKPDDSD